MSNEKKSGVEIESNGDFHLGKRDGKYVISDPNSGASISLKQMDFTASLLPTMLIIFWIKTAIVFD